MEIDANGIGLILGGLATLLGAFKIPEIVKYFRDKDGSRIKELELMIAELEKEIELEKEKRISSKLEHANSIEMLKQKYENVKQNHLVVKMNFNVVKSLIHKATLTQKEMQDFIETLDDDNFDVTPAQT